MITVNCQVSSGADDGNIDTDGTFKNTSNYFPLGKYASVPWLSDKSFARWAVTVPKGAVISSAYISLYWDSAYWAPMPTVAIYFDKSANSGAIANESDFDSRTKTTAVVNWTVTGNSGWNNTADIKNIIQELVNANGYDGQYMQAMIVSPYDCGCRYKSYDAGASYAPKLYIEYASGGVGLIGPGLFQSQLIRGRLL